MFICHCFHSSVILFPMRLQNHIDFDIVIYFIILKCNAKDQIILLTNTLLPNVIPECKNSELTQNYILLI